MTYRKKWLSITLGLLLVSNLVVCTFGLMLLHTFTYRVAEEQKDQLCENLISRVEKEMTMLSTVADFLCGKETTAYLTSLVHLLPEEQATQYKQDFEDHLREIDLDTAFIQAVAFIGENENQATYLYETATQTESLLAIPTIETWSRSGLADMLLGEGNFAYVQSSDIDDLLKNPYFMRYPDQKDVVRVWLERIQDQYCFIQPRERYSVVLVLNERIFTQYETAYPWKEDGVAVYTAAGRPMWKTAEWVMEARRGQQQVLLESTRFIGNSSWTLYYARRSQNDSYEQYLLIFFGCSTVLLVVAICVVNHRAKRILRPFERFTEHIRQAIDSDGFEVIPPNDATFVNRRPLYREIFRLFISGLVMPVICMGAISVVLITGYLSPRLDELAQLQSISLQGSVNSSLETSEKLLQMLSQKPEFAEVTSQNIGSLDSNAYRQSALELNSHITRYPLGMYNIAYLVLLDLDGNAKYQSLFLNEESPQNQLGLFALLNQPDALAQLRDLTADTGLLLCENIYGQPAVSSVKKLYDSDGKLLGYLQMVHNQSYFQEISSRQSVTFLVAQQSDGRQVFNNGTDDFYRAFSKLNLSGDEQVSVTVAGRGYLVDTRSVDSAGWTLAVFQRTDDLTSQSTLAISQNLLLIGSLLLLLFFLSFLLAYWMSQPLKAIEQDLGRIIENGCRSFLPYEKKDELGRLVETYNQVIGQLNQLMDSMMEKKIIEQRLVNLQAQAELESLRQQIASHFFRNTLENIHMQVKIGDQSSACRMIVALSRLFSYGLNNRDRIELDKEIDYVENYILIQRLRLHDAFEVRWEVDRDTRLIIVPKLILQPLIENCITHGLYEYQSGGLIIIRIYRKEGFLHMEIEDNGVGISRVELEKLRDSLRSDTMDELSDRGNGLALRNISLRLRMYGGEKASITVDSRPMEGTTVHICLPIDA